MREDEAVEASREFGRLKDKEAHPEGFEEGALIPNDRDE